MSETSFRRARVAVARLSWADRFAIFFRGWAIVYMHNAKAHTEVHVTGRLPKVPSERETVGRAVEMLKAMTVDAEAANEAKATAALTLAGAGEEPFRLNGCAVSFEDHDVVEDHVIACCPGCFRAWAAAHPWKVSSNA